MAYAPDLSRLLTPGARYADEHDEYMIEPHPSGTSRRPDRRHLPAAENLCGSGQPGTTWTLPGCPRPGMHLNCPGRYAFTTQPPADLRPLRDPNARDAADDDF
jgi:hypothetical protein